MRNGKFIIWIIAVLMLAGCGAKKKAVSRQEPAVSEPAWHTCLVQGARATVTTDEDKLSANLTMQAVHDSMVVISIMPMLGIEMLRLEATPTELTAIDKLHGRYAKTTYAELNRKLTPSMNWDILQQVCSAELPTGPDRARLQYMFGNRLLDIVIEYSPRQIDVPVRVMPQRLDKYTRVDISQWLE